MMEPRRRQLCEIARAADACVAGLAVITMILQGRAVGSSDASACVSPLTIPTVIIYSLCMLTTVWSRDRTARSFYAAAVHRTRIRAGGPALPDADDADAGGLSGASGEFYSASDGEHGTAFLIILAVICEIGALCYVALFGLLKLRPCVGAFMTAWHALIAAIWIVRLFILACQEGEQFSRFDALAVARQEAFVVHLDRQDRERLDRVEQERQHAPLDRAQIETLPILDLAAARLCVKSRSPITSRAQTPSCVAAPEDMRINVAELPGVILASDGSSPRSTSHVLPSPAADRDHSPVCAPAAPSSDVGDCETDRCSICLDGFGGPDSPVKQMPRCSHFFHVLCIESWLLRSNTCPLCVRTVVLRMPPPS